MGHVRLTLDRKTKIIKKATEAFYSDNVKYSCLLDSKLPTSFENMLVNYLFDDPGLIDIAKITYSIKDKLSDYVDFSYYNPEKPTRTIFRKPDNSNCIKRDHSPYENLINRWPLKNKSLEESEKEVNVINVQFQKTSIFKSNFYSRSGLNNQHDEVLAYIDMYANVSIDELFDEVCYFDHKQHQQQFDCPILCEGNTSNFENSYHAHELFLNYPLTMPKFSVRDRESQRTVFMDDPFILNIFQNYVIGKLKIIQNFSVFDKGNRATVDACSTVRQLLQVNPAFEPFIEPEDLAKTNSKQTKIVKTVEQIRQELENKGVSTEGLAEVAFTSQLEN